MMFVSTRGGTPPVTLSQALRLGAAPGGGLFMPSEIPRHESTRFAAGRPLAQFAADWLRPFFDGDPLAADLDAICAEAFTFPVPLVAALGGDSSLRALELFHGPTGAFKDFGARFLLACFDRLAGDEPLTVLAATSGDTGGAVGCAAEGRRSARAVILYPKDRVSPFQERQLTCWGDNVAAVEVDGDFDACQAMVKAAFADPRLSASHRLTSANSINLGRLLPQVAYCAHAAFEAAALNTGNRPGFIIPSGNLGHGFALLLARAMGAPVGPVVLATNANRTLLDWCQTGRYQPRPSVATLANAMDVGNPSNFERVAALGDGAAEVAVELAHDEAIRHRIAADYRDSGYVWCPHSAIAAEAWRRLAGPARDERLWVAAATAHPFKFAEIVEPLIGRALEPSSALAAIAGRPTARQRIAPHLADLAALLEQQRVAA
ncbi:threonine synthase [Sphingomonas kaistensis]|uniref:Threonine synthase n=1 Tax=Sphingomonas kaistensis TaxID=298708 RepID=A0A7X6BHY6_9SPHN|nr:threonine synthase [Sphingomonas kaistensis]NJC06606.1 threonine synthase [Sphingomonas kaistensis]